MRSARLAQLVLSLILILAVFAVFAHTELGWAVPKTVRLQEAEMSLLRLDLQDGFQQDTVVIQVNGKEVFRRSQVETRLQLGYADSVEVNVPEGLTKIEIAVPSRKLSDSLKLQIAAPTHLGISLTSKGKIDYRTTSEPFTYE
ncbi:hypothetical protein [Leptolyngbya sp. FACHB-261]|uniref:hypothetical protein n=1 Tax=Leptolyngbya sp. FACHB-261 TaxID=2692806 RepID=UPI0016831A44|nr:hypothetical protein [Leptolyngbya sp. FACHB-261]MBD2100550.1 hypothetical protein [Leptolyngbya sp. FACHB-261]